MTLTATRHPDHRPRHIYPDTPATYSDGIDWIAVERAANGEHANPAALTQPELEAAWGLLLTNGRTPTEAARRTGTTYEQVRDWGRAAGLIQPKTTTARAAA